MHGQPCPTHIVPHNKGQAQKHQPSGNVQNSVRGTKRCLLLHCLFFRSALTTLADFQLNGQRAQTPNLGKLSWMYAWSLRKHYPVKLPLVVSTNCMRTFEKLSLCQCDQSHVHGRVAAQRVFRSSKMAKAIIESYYPNKLHTFAPNHSHAFVTRNLSRKEWTANPKASSQS